MINRLFIILLISISTGCSPLLIDLEQSGKYDASLITIKDLRTEADREDARDIRETALILLEDFKPDILNVLSSAMIRNKPEQVKKINLEINQFNIYDSYPVRFKKGVYYGSGVVGSLISVVKAPGKYDRDKIICKLQGNMNGMALQIESRVIYGKLTSHIVRNDLVLKSAILECIDDLAERSWSK